MKFLPLRELEPINRALSFDTPDLRIVGGCEIYTTKAAGGDKKLYKSISDTLSSRYEADLRLNEQLSPPEFRKASTSSSSSESSSSSYQSKAVYQTLHSPFGPLNQIWARKTFAYMIATLNASHPDYDFSSVLRPSDFRRERSLRNVMNTFNTTLFNLGVNVNRSLPTMWETIDKEMDLSQCNLYSYSPDDMTDDPYGEEGLIWSTIYFFFNKHKKRVCYLYLRGISALSHVREERYAGGMWVEDSGEESEDWAETRSIWGDEFDEAIADSMEDI